MPSWVTVGPHSDSPTTDPGHTRIQAWCCTSSRSQMGSQVAIENLPNLVFSHLKTYYQTRCSMVYFIIWSLIKTNKRSVTKKTHHHLDTGKPHYKVTVWEVSSSSVRHICPFWAPPVLVPCPTLHEECWVPSVKWGCGACCVPSGPFTTPRKKGQLWVGQGPLDPGGLLSFHIKERRSTGPSYSGKKWQSQDLVKYSHLSDHRLCPLSLFYLLRNPKLLGEEKSFILGEESVFEWCRMSLLASAFSATLGVKWVSSIIIIAKCQGVNWRMVNPVQTSRLNEENNWALSVL